jgi:hypothetical protein
VIGESEKAVSIPAYDPEYAWLVAASQCPAPRPEDGPTHYGDDTPKCGAANGTRLYTVWALVDCPACRAAAS